MQYVSDFELLFDEVSLDEIVNVEAKKWYNFLVNRNISLYHYTSLKGIEGILSSSSIWFTESSHLNDESEGKYLYILLNEFLSSYSIDEEFEKFKNEIKNSIIHIDAKYFFDYHKERGGLQAMENFPHFFISSFCKNDDALTMWNYYSKSVNKIGYNIAFSLDDLRASVSEVIKNELKLPGELRVFKVLYNLHKQKKLLKEAIDFFYDKWEMTTFKEYVLLTLAQYLYEIKFALKHPAFALEQEYRLIIKVCSPNACEDITVSSEKILVRATNDGFIPYISVPFKKSDIRHIKASPLTANYESIKYILQKNGYNNVGVDKSNIPLRF